MGSWGVNGGESARDGETAPTIGDWVRLLRVHQWIKNFFVLAPLLFSGRANEGSAVLAACVVFVAFCLLSSCVYILNDAADREADRAHPTKRNRPLASGRLTLGAGLGAAFVLGSAGLAFAFGLNSTAGLIGASYLGLNVLYSLYLKRVVILDVFSLAGFFLLRLLAGSAAVEVTPSVWLLLCGGLLALYLGFAKRRHELSLMKDNSVTHRKVLEHYSPMFLDQMSVVLLSVTIVSYIMYTLVSDTAVAVRSGALLLSTVFVLYGVFRYLYLVHQQDGGSPTETLLTDRALLVNILLWLTYCGWVIYQPF